VSSWKHQTLIEAPVPDVWALVGDPRSYPEWAAEVLEVTGFPEEVMLGAEWDQTSKSPFGKQRTRFVVDELDDLREIRLRCTVSGYYSHWVLTEAGDDTFCEVEIGMEPQRIPDKVIDRTVGKRWYRSAATSMLDRIRAKVS
jgi:hypothetical protein